MKLHRNLVQATELALSQIFKEHKYADRVLEKVLASDKRWGARDRAFIAETTYEIVRWKRWIEAIGELDAMPNSYMSTIGVWLVSEGLILPDWPEFKDLDPKKIKANQEHFLTLRVFRESIPDWMDNMGEAELGSAWEKEINALNQPAPVILRANTLKTSPRSLRRLLETRGISIEWLKEGPDALQLTERRNVFTTEEFKAGFFEVQDISSQQVAPFLQVEPGMRVVDACAGAGGKTLHLAALMQNKGKIIALDTEEWKLENMKTRAKRAGVSIIEPRTIDSAKVIKRLHETADALLLDVPCSGLGVLRRNPDAKWKLKPEFIENIKHTQQEILQTYSSILKPGGKMVYATCSILPSENYLQIQTFLSSSQGKLFELESEKNIYPSQQGWDGFYMARLRRK